MASKNSKKGGKGGKTKNKENLEPEKKTNRPAKLRGWSSESMVEAMKAVKEGQAKWQGYSWHQHGSYTLFDL